jgi:hypothetical protein
LYKFTSISEVLIILMMEAASTSEMSVNFYQTTWCNIPEDIHLQENTYSPEGECLG